jgi:hypothetical protein
LPGSTIPADRHFPVFKNVLIPVKQDSCELQKLDSSLPIIIKNKSKALLYSLAKKGQINRYDIRHRILIWASNLIKFQIDSRKEVKVCKYSAETVIKKATDKQFDLIVITANTTTRLQDIFRSNYTKKVINDSQVPVLSIKTN